MNESNEIPSYFPGTIVPIAYTKTPLALFEKRKASYKYSLSKPSSHRSYSGHRQKGPAPGYPRTGASLFIRKKLSFYFRLANRTHSVIRAYGRRTASSAPTADAQRHPRLRRSLRKQTVRSLFSAPQGKPYRGSRKIVS